MTQTKTQLNSYIQRLPCFGHWQCWIEKNLWESVVDSFNFASKNWEEFTNAVKSVSRTGHFWKENNKIFKFDETFDGYDESLIQKQFRSLDSNRDSEISAEEFNGHFDGTFFNGHFEEFSAKYWPVFDLDKSGKMNFEENQYFWAAYADGVARLVLKVGKLRYLR